MNKEVKLTEREMEELRKVDNKIVKRALEYIEFIDANPAVETYIALKLSHNNICEELQQKKVQLFNEENGNEKIFDKYLKWKASAESEVQTLLNLKAKLTAEEQQVVLKKMKNSEQLYFNKNGSKVVSQ
jgi:hypoxanthine phosphoribosyltransferase